MLGWAKRKPSGSRESEPSDTNSEHKGSELADVQSASVRRGNRDSPDLEWDPADFLLHFGTEPSVWEDGESYAYRVEREGVWLMLHVWPHRSAVYPAVVRNDKSIMTLGVVVRSPVQRRIEQWGEFLDFPDCVVIPEKYFLTGYPDAWDRGRYADGLNLSIRVTPSIEVVLS